MSYEQPAMLNRRRLLQTLSARLVAAPLAAGAQTGKVPRIGVLASPSPVFFVTRLNAFREGLRDLGYLEGKNIAVEYRFADGKEERLPDLVAELIRLKVDVILTSGTPAARAAKAATTTVPIIFTGVGDAVRIGLVASFARPGGNITGLSLLVPELSAKRLALLKESFPSVNRVAVILNPSNPANPVYLEEMRLTAQALAIQLQPKEMRGLKDVEAAFESAIGGGAHALVVLPDPLINTHHKLIVDFAAKHRLPAIYGGPEFVEAGGLMSYAASYTDAFRRAAIYVDKVLKGAKPGDLPIEQPTKFELVINLKTAKAVGLTIPQPVLLRADRLIE